MLVLGDNDRSELADTEQPFLLIDDGPLCEIFKVRFPKAKLFDYETHGLNPLPADYKMRRVLMPLLWSDEGQSTLTVRNGKRALRDKLKAGAKQFDKIIFNNGDADKEASDALDELMDGPVLSKVLNKKPPRFLLSGSSVIARLGPELEEQEAMVMGSILALLTQSHVIISQFGDYVQPFHRQLFRAKRLSIGLNNLEEVDKKMRQRILQMPEKIGRGCTYEDATELAKYDCPFAPGTMEHTAFVQERMRRI